MMRSNSSEIRKAFKARAADEIQTLCICLDFSFQDIIHLLGAEIVESLFQFGISD